MWVIAGLAIVHLWSAGWIASRFWRPRRLADFLPVMLLTAWATFYGFPIILGWSTGRISVWTIFLSAAAAAILGTAARFGFKAAAPAFRLRDFRFAWKSMPWIQRILWAFIGLFLLGTLYIGSHWPARTWDAVGYHSHNYVRWAETHRFTLDGYGNGRLDGYVGAAEIGPNVKAILPFLVLEFTGDTDGTAMAQWPYVALLAVCLYAIFRRNNFPRWSGPLAVLFCFAAPEFLLQSIESYGDITFFAGQMAVVWICLVIWQEGVDWRILALGALAFALLAGTKSTALIMCGILGLGYLAIVWLKSNAPNLLTKGVRTFAALSLVIVTSLAIAGPWYLRGLRVYRNPIYPYRVVVGKTELLPGLFASDINTVLAAKFSGQSGLTGWWGMMVERGRTPVLSSWSSGLGAHAFILGLPCVILLAVGVCWRDRRRLVVLLLFLIMIMGSPTQSIARLVLFETALGALGFLWVIEQSPRIIRGILLTIFGLLMVYNAARTIPAMFYRTRPPELVAYALLSGHRSTWMAGNHYPDEFTVLDLWREDIAKPGDKLGYIDGSPVVLHPLEPKASIIRIPRFTPEQGVESWVESLRFLGVTHLYFPSGTPECRAALGHPRLFHLILRRVDSAGGFNWNVDSSPEAALFALPPLGRK